ncbi:hypothetical protein LCGC14_0963730 [marine sediment metagenome]|uniref:Uncharacterized protein n=1 Tax=marine sediment metagenome TaxID=412755 RepID=A0A0F9NDT6_9ZZZZ|nr:hypothetical protein [Candidatus Aminicenantes bacterium]
MSDTNLPPSITSPVSRDEFDKERKRIDYILIAVNLVLLLGFVTLLVTVSGLVMDASRFKAETYQNLVNQVSNNNYKVDQLISSSYCKDFSSSVGK